jgi:hypothetical protein
MNSKSNIVTSAVDCYGKLQPQIVSRSFSTNKKWKKPQSFNISVLTISSVILASIAWGNNVKANFIDTFQTATDANNYTLYVAYQGGSVAPTLTTGNGVATLNTPDDTTYALWNQGQTLGPGDSVSVVMTGGLTSSGDIGMGFGSGTLSPLSLSRFEILAYEGTSSTQLEWAGGGTAVPGFDPTATDPGTITFSRETGANANVYNILVQGGGMTSPVSIDNAPNVPSDPNATVYFGLGAFGTSATFSSLSYTAVPEPAALGLFGVGAIGMLLLWKRASTGRN